MEDAPLSQEALKFIVKFKAELEKRGLTKIVGLARYPGDDFRAHYPADLKHIPTIWFFSEVLWKRGCRCTCNASSEDHPHGAHVITTSG
ncbi:hypothetical protein F5Y03DRAFT_401912 [Xylaria venustula]|nr:hypothetical protein F5Y03DRAFT_401912 [Xylaria venustula]